MALKQDVINVKFTAWEPDKARLGGGQAQEAQGVIPAADGYIPLPSLARQTSVPVLPSPWRGGMSFEDDDGLAMNIVGTSTALYRKTSGEWQELGSGYQQSESLWDFARYGDMIIAVNGIDVPQYATISQGVISQFQAIPTAPEGARTVEIVKEFVVLGGVQKTKVRWSAIGNPLDWPTPGSNDAQYKQSDEQDFPDTGSTAEVIGALTGIDMLVFTEYAIYLGTYIGSPLVFQFDILDKGRGTIAPRSVVATSNAAYFLGEEGFFATDGSNIVNIGSERVNRWFNDTSARYRRKEMRGVADPVRGIIIWTFAGTAAPEGLHDHLLIYHPSLNRWSYGKALTTGIMRIMTDAMTLEDLDAVAPLDLLPYSLDSEYWMGGVPGLAAFDENNGLGYFGGAPMAAVIDTAETGGKRVMVHGVRPLVDAGLAGAGVWRRDLQHLPPVLQPCAPVSAFDGVCYCHESTRYFAARVTIPAGEDWTHAVGCDVLTELEGSI
jgi:hypothetical protein